MLGKQIKRSNWSSISKDEILSESVRSFPCLYDKSDKGYKEMVVVEMPVVLGHDDVILRVFCGPEIFRVPIIFRGRRL